MEVATIILHAAILAALIAAQYRRIDRGKSVDGERYAAMAAGDVVQRPYCYRVMVPWSARGLSRVFDIDEDDTLYAVASAGNVACVVAVYALTLSLGGSYWSAFAASAVVVTTQAAFGSWVMFPMLVDSWSLAFGVAAVAVAPLSPVAAAILLVLAAMTKEAALALAWAFAVVVDPSLWWVGLPGVAALAVLYASRSAAPPLYEWESPLHPLMTKRTQWLSYAHTLSGLGAVPWIAAYCMPETRLAIPALAVFMLALAQTLIANDHARLVGASAPFVVASLCVVAPAPAVAVLVIAQVFWPFPYREHGWF